MRLQKAFSEVKILIFFLDSRFFLISCIDIDECAEGLDDCAKKVWKLNSLQILPKSINLVTLLNNGKRFYREEIASTPKDLSNARSLNPRRES